MAKSPIFDSSVFSPYGKLIEPQIATALFPSIVFTNWRRQVLTNQLCKNIIAGGFRLTKLTAFWLRQITIGGKPQNQFAAFTSKKLLPFQNSKLCKMMLWLRGLPLKTTVLSLQWMLMISRLSSGKCRNSKSFRVIIFSVRLLFLLGMANNLPHFNF